MKVVHRVYKSQKIILNYKIAGKLARKYTAQRQKHNNTYVTSQAETAAAAATLGHKRSGRTAYKLRDSMPTLTDFDLRPNGHTQPWSAV